MAGGRGRGGRIMTADRVGNVVVKHQSQDEGAQEPQEPPFHREKLNRTLPFCQISVVARRASPESLPLTYFLNGSVSALSRRLTHPGMRSRRIESFFV